MDRRDVIDASRRIAGHVLRTPLIEASIDGRRIWLKCECLQTGGAFKLRGATNRLLQLDAEERKSGVVAFSSGNHAQGVAIAARRLGMPATIVMPSDAPRIKVDGTRAQGADIVFYDRATEDRVTIARYLAAERGATVVPAFDDRHVIAGQGTVGLEILDQLAEAGEPAPPTVAMPCGGGGLAAGIALACPDARIVAAEPEGWDDMARSLALGEIVPVASGRAAYLVRFAADAEGVADHVCNPSRPAGASRRGVGERSGYCRRLGMAGAPPQGRARRCGGAGFISCGKGAGR